MQTLRKDNEVDENQFCSIVLTYLSRPVSKLSNSAAV